MTVSGALAAIPRFAAGLAEGAWRLIRRALAPVADPLFGPLARRMERWEASRLRRHRDEDFDLADQLDRAGLPDSAEKLRRMHR